MNTRYSTGTDLQRASTTPIGKALAASGAFLVSVIFLLISAGLFLLDGTETDSYFHPVRHTSDAALWCLLIAVVFGVIGFPKYFTFVRKRNACITAMRGTYLVLNDEFVGGLSCYRSEGIYKTGNYFEAPYSAVSQAEAISIDPNALDYATLRICIDGTQHYFAIDGSQEAAYIIKKKLADSAI